MHNNMCLTLLATLIPTDDYSHQLNEPEDQAESNVYVEKPVGIDTSPQFMNPLFAVDDGSESLAEKEKAAEGMLVVPLCGHIVIISFWGLEIRPLFYSAISQNPSPT